MEYKDQKSFFYTDEEMHQLFILSDGFNDDINSNHRVRTDGKSFSEFMDEGCDALIRDHRDLVKQLI